MLINGKEKLERMRDGRAIYIGAERVDDVTRHPAFRNAAQTIAGLYELKADPGQRDLFTFEEDGERYGLPWLRCRTREDLARRMRAMKAIADATYGMIGRSPDHVAGLITGLAMKPALLDSLTPGFGENLIRYYDQARKNDLYLSFAVTPPSGIRAREIFTGEARDDPTLQVVGDAGVGPVSVVTGGSLPGSRAGCQTAAHDRLLVPARGRGDPPQGARALMDERRPARVGGDRPGAAGRGRSRPSSSCASSAREDWGSGCRTCRRSGAAWASATTAMAAVSAEAAKVGIGPFVLNAQAPDEGNMHTLLHWAHRRAEGEVPPAAVRGHGPLVLRHDRARGRRLRPDADPDHRRTATATSG